MIKFCTLFSGSSGNSIFISDGTTKLLIDAGVSGKKTLEALYSIDEDPSDLSAVLITHEHSDHTKGAGILSRKLDIPIYANESTWKQIDTQLGEIRQCNKRHFVTGCNFELGRINIKPFLIPHDAIEPVGFSLFIENKKITTATDIGHMNNSILENLIDSDIILLEANHDVEMLKVGPYPWNLKQRVMGENGHLSNEMAGKTVAYLAENGSKNFLLGHLSKENNFPELAYQTVYNILSSKGIMPGVDISLEIAQRDCVGTVILA